MSWIGILYVTGMLILMSLFALGGYLLQRDRYWMRIWKDLGKPEVKSINELKTYIKNKHCIISLNLNDSRIESDKRL